MIEGEKMIKIRAEIKQKKWSKKKTNQYHKKGSLGEEKQNRQIIVQTYQEKEDNKLINFDMIKDDIITDITEITKNHKGLQQTTILQ